MQIKFWKKAGKLGELAGGQELFQTAGVWREFMEGFALLLRILHSLSAGALFSTECSVNRAKCKRLVFLQLSTKKKILLFVSLHFVPNFCILLLKGQKIIL